MEPTASPTSPTVPRRPRRVVPLDGLTALVWIAGLSALLVGIPAGGLPGWDESGHAHSALRMGTALGALDFGAFWEEFHRPDFYTGLGRLPLAPVFLIDDGFSAPRGATGLAWFLTIGLAAVLARRLVPADRRGWVSLFTVLFGASGWLGISYARGAYQEPWLALVLVVAALVYLRARELGSLGLGFATGLIVGAALVMKATYGLYLAGAVLGTAGIDVLLRRPRALALVATASVGIALVLAWWFVLPLPMGLDVGRAHWEKFRTYLTKAAILTSPARGVVGIWWGWQLTPTPLVALLQLAGIGWGLARWREAPARLCALFALAGLAGPLVYSYRIDRFMLPAAFALWVLGAVVATMLVFRARARLRPLVGAGLVLLLWLTRGLGAETALVALMPAEQFGAVDPATGEPEHLALALAEAERWTEPYAARPVPASGPPGLERVLDLATLYFDPAKPFAWIGGTGTELPLTLIEWRLYQATRDRSILLRERSDTDHFLGGDPGWTEERFRAWAAGFPQIGSLDPPDPKNRPQGFERTFASWMFQHPGFRCLGVEQVSMEIRPGVDHEFDVLFYVRLDEPTEPTGPTGAEGS